MANPTVSDLIARVRSNVKDNSATAANQSLTDTEVVGALNVGMRLAQRRYVPRPVGQTATQTGLSLGADGFSAITTPTNYSRIVALMLVAAPGDTYGVPLAYKDMDEFMSLRGGQSFSQSPADAGAVSNIPVYYTAWREGTATIASQGKWRVLFHPPSGVNPLYASAIVELEQADLSAGALTVSPDVSPEACSMAEMIASYLCGQNLGRANADSFLKLYPEVKDEVQWKAREEGKAQAARTKDRA